MNETIRPIRLYVGLSCCPSGEHLVPYDDYKTRDEAVKAGEEAVKCGYASYQIEGEPIVR